MKKILSLLLIVSLFALPSKAQIFPQGQDTSRVTVTLKARHHAYLIAFMSDRGDAEKVRYITQVASQIVDTVDKDKPVTVTVSESLIKTLYVAIGSQQERLTTVYNEEIRQALLPQIQDRQNLLNSIQEIADRNQSETEQMVLYGFSYILLVKQ